MELIICTCYFAPSPDASENHRPMSRLRGSGNPREPPDLTGVLKKANSSALAKTSGIVSRVGVRGLWNCANSGQRAEDGTIYWFNDITTDRIWILGKDMCLVLENKKFPLELIINI